MLFAVLLDQALGEPAAWHPLVGFGQLANLIEKIFHPGTDNQEHYLLIRLRGALAVVLSVTPFVLAAFFLGRIPFFGWLFNLVMLYLSLGGSSLSRHARDVLSALTSDDLDSARSKVGFIVSRDTEGLDETEVTRAAIESVLENGSDAIFGALFWFLVLGAPGVVLYRLSNTLDAMWGYRNSRYMHFGWAAARLDDVLNFIPARLTAATYTLLGNTRSAWQCWRSQAPGWYSPNAGPVMAAGAGALDLELGGPASYHGKRKERPLLGKGRPPGPQDIERALTLVRNALWLWVTLVILGGLFHA